MLVAILGMREEVAATICHASQCASVSIGFTILSQHTRYSMIIRACGAVSKLETTVFGRMLFTEEAAPTYRHRHAEEELASVDQAISAMS